MIDLIKRLRTMAATGWNPIGDEAADEITHLRAEVERLEREARFNDISVLPEKDAEYADLRAENERLRVALKAISEVKPNWGSESEEMYELARAALEEK